MVNPRTANRETSKQESQIRRSLVTLVALGLFPAASIWAANPATGLDLFKVFVLGLVVGTAAFVCAMGFRRVVGVSLSTVTAVAAVALTFFAFWNLLSNALSSALPSYEVPRVLLPLVFSFALLLAVRMARSPWAMTVMSWAAIGLLATASGQAVWAKNNLRPPDIEGELAFPVARAGAQSPNIYYIVLDGYARDDVLSDLFNFDNAEFITSLRNMGFHVPSAATANYSMTYASLTSALVMEYPIVAGSSLGPSERKAMYEVLGGANPVVETFHRAGYAYYHLESGWGGTRCGEEVDRCYQAPFLEESVWAFLQRSALARLLRTTYGHSFPFDGLDRLMALRAIAEDTLAADRPVAVFAHVLLPHPPSLITSDCEVRFDPMLEGMQTGAPWLGGEEVLSMRKRAYVGELQCVNRIILDLVGTLVDTDDIVVLMADHGTASRAQLIKPVEKWSVSEIKERLSTFMAIRLPEECNQGLSDELMVVNSFRTVLRCAVNADLPDLPPRHFLVNVEENHPDDAVIEVDLSATQ